jgi:hypothetical protein
VGEARFRGTEIVYGKSSFREGESGGEAEAGVWVVRIADGQHGVG